MVQVAFHVPVLKKEAVENLITNREGVYVDGTLGGGGHAWEILCQLEKSGSLIAIDCDPEAICEAQKTLAKFNGRVSFHQTGFWNLRGVLRQQGIEQVDGILLDLGISSHQIDSPQRGFSYRFDGPLDMRMNPKGKKTARDVVNTYTERQLLRIFYEYGQERLASRIARKICQERKREQIENTLQLRTIIESVIPNKRPEKTLSRIFQAIRIEVNNEIRNLRKALEECIELLREGGRICVISYHSLEDRIVKSTFVEYARGCTCPPHLPVCICGKNKVLRIVGRGAVLPSEGEKRDNPRARSAKLRVAEKIGA